jgi:hypothetical protein
VKEPTVENIGQHLRHEHGYDIAYSASAHPSVLLREHDRIHENGIAKNHDHEKPE